MPDLSNLLGAVYGDTPPPEGRDPEDEAHVEHEPAASDRGPAVPDWADDEHLDAAFAQWKPGPSADASPVERAFVKDADDDPPPPPLADDLAAALSEALVAASGTADDTAETPTDLHQAQQYDFTADADEPDEDPSEEAERPQAFAPLHPVEDFDEDPSEEAEPPQAFAPLHPTEDPVEEPEPAAQPEPVVDEQPEPEPEPEHVEHVEPTHHVDASEDDVRSSITPQRAAAAELTAASRIDTEPVAATPPPALEPLPKPAPVPVAAVRAPVPVAPTPVPSPGDGAVAPTTLPAGTRRWERGDDDILPEKQARKFFSFSLRRG